MNNERRLNAGEPLGKGPNMWFTSKCDLGVHKDLLFNELVQECKLNPPSSRLSAQLRMRLEKLSPEVRREISCRQKDGCAPLFIAAKRGLCEVVEYLITVLNADVEQRGFYEVSDDRSIHCVTPLWCAAVSGRLGVIRCLVEHGADVNAPSDTGSTPVRSACFMTHYDIVAYLVEHGADILRPNYNGGTCLINSVQSSNLCTFLLQHGADVNTRDIQNKTALHYAIQEHRFETTKLLLDHGADPFAKSRYNDDALQTACLKGAVQIFEYLVSTINYSAERLADAHELLGSTFLDEYNDLATTLQHWYLATQLRTSYREMTNEPLPKRPEVPRRAAFRNAVEFTTIEELSNISLDLDAMRIQSLLICERVLGPQHKDTLFRLMYRGAAYADSLRYQRCIDLWLRALEIRVEKDTILFNDTCFTAQALVRLFVDLKLKYSEAFRNGSRRYCPKFQDLMNTFRILAKQLTEMKPFLVIKPVQKRQQESYDRILKCVTHLIYLVMEAAVLPEQKDMVREVIVDLLRHNTRSATTGDTLLHLCVSRLNTINSTYFGDENKILFPSIEVIEFLLECGAPVNAKNESQSTTLHIASNPYNYSASLVQLLLDYGAHLDQPNRAGECPWMYIACNPENNISLGKYTTLRCLAASAVVKHHIPYVGQIPKTLEAFVKFHE